MANKLWEKNFEVNAEIERFTVGRDREMDLYLAPYDVMGSMAHITMLESIGLIGKDELPLLLQELKNIYAICQRGEFQIGRVNWAIWVRRFTQDAHATIRYW